MGSTKEDDEEDHLEEGDVEVAWSKGKPDDAKDGGAGSLDYGHAQGVKACSNPLLGRLVILRHVVVADVSREVHREADTHDEVDQGHPVQVDVPPSHVADYTSLGKVNFQLDS